MHNERSSSTISLYVLLGWVGGGGGGGGGNGLDVAVAIIHG